MKTNHSLHSPLPSPVPSQRVQEQNVFPLWRAEEENGSCEQEKKHIAVLLSSEKCRRPLPFSSFQGNCLLLYLRPSVCLLLSSYSQLENKNAIFLIFFLAHRVSNSPGWDTYPRPTLPLCWVLGQRWTLCPPRAPQGMCTLLLVA